MLKTLLEHLKKVGEPVKVQITDMKCGKYKINGTAKHRIKFETDHPELLQSTLENLGVKTVIKDGHLYVVNM